MNPSISRFDFISIDPLLVQFQALPVHFARLTRELRTLSGVLHQLDLHPARILDPGLPAVIPTQLLIADLPALRSNFKDRRIQVFHLQADVVQQPGPRPAFPLLLEYFYESRVASRGIEPEWLAVLDEFKRLLHPQNIAVEIFAGR